MRDFDKRIIKRHVSNLILIIFAALLAGVLWCLYKTGYFSGGYFYE